MPRIGLDAPVVEVGWQVVQRGDRQVTEWEVADFAAGFHKGSAYPGNGSNTVISGHHNIRGEVFRDLHKLDVGDDVYLFVEDQEYHYSIRAKHLLREKGMPEDVRRQNARFIQPTSYERLTLVTCWPYTGNSHRIIILARPVLPD